MEGNSTGTGVSASSAVANAEVSQPQNTGDAVENTANNVPAAEGQNGAEGTEAVTLESIFEKYPELKKENDKRTQKAVQSRVHQMNKSMQGKNQIIDKLMVAHGVKDIKELEAKLDDSLAEEFSIRNGVDSEIGKEMLRLRLGEKQRNDAEAYYQSRERADRQYNAWMEEAQALRELYPDMDLNKELENPEFVRLLTASDEQYRMPMKKIYELIHHDDIIKATEKRVASAYAQSVNANISRPIENGVGNNSAVSSNSDVSKLTRKERAELAKRASLGETISFR